MRNFFFFFFFFFSFLNVSKTSNNSIDIKAENELNEILYRYYDHLEFADDQLENVRKSCFDKEAFQTYIMASYFYARLNYFFMNFDKVDEIIKDLEGSIKDKTLSIEDQNLYNIVVYFLNYYNGNVDINLELPLDTLKHSRYYHDLFIINSSIIGSHYLFEKDFDKYWKNSKKTQWITKEHIIFIGTLEEYYIELTDKFRKDGLVAYEEKTLEWLNEHKDIPTVMYYHLFYTLGMTLFYSGFEEKGCQYLGKSIKVGSSAPYISEIASYHIALYYLEFEDEAEFKKSLQFMDLFKQISDRYNPNFSNGSYTFILAHYYIKLGQYKKAKETFIDFKNNKNFKEQEEFYKTYVDEIMPFLEEKYADNEEIRSLLKTVCEEIVYFDSWDNKTVELQVEPTESLEKATEKTLKAKEKTFFYNYFILFMGIISAIAFLFFYKQSKDYNNMKGR